MDKKSALSSFLSEEEKTRITAAVAEAELSTSGEIVTVVVPSSSSYPGARWRLAVTVSFLAALIFYWVDASFNPIYYLLIQLPALLLGLALANIDGVLRLFLMDVQVAQQVHRRALEAFYSNDLSFTRDRTGILIFISLLEHRAIILADKGIHAKVKLGSWDEIISHLLVQIRDGNLAEGICNAIRECGKILTQNFPTEKGSKNELANQVIIGE